MRCGEAVDALGGRKQAAAEFGLFVGDDHTGTRLSRGAGGGEAGWSGADHQDFAMGVDVVVAVGIRSVGGVAEAGGVAQEVLVERPEAAGPHEGLVVEAGGDERSGHETEGMDIRSIVQAGPGVDVADFAARAWRG